ncbi:hypothetical protein C1H46_025361 [Malus baccata]|uniref:Vacuolar iron transporter n=1 Tax=Malus baccata TaxID=106549 RepID=A0A540LRF1_MALBA|nr:hypothetical protein C1H46_025361 [Malus baccata]
MDTSHQTLETPVEHKLPVTDDENYTKTEQAQRAQWLRAALLGASDGLLSTTSLMLGVGAAKVDRWTMILSGVAGAVAGACSMAVGEFVSVSTQRDIEKTSLLRQSSLKTEMGKKERNEKSNLTISIEPTPSRVIPSGNSPSKPPEQPEKARKTTAVEITQVSEGEESLPSPHKAASASALAFLCGSLVPLLSAVFIPQNTIRIAVVVVVASIALAFFGGVGARMGGSPAMPSAFRVLVGGWIAMAITYGLLHAI